MKLSSTQIQRLSDLILNEWKKSSLVQFKVDEKIILKKINDIITADYQREAELDKEVMKMVDQLEKSHGGEFQKYKMIPLLKQKLAKERKIIL